MTRRRQALTRRNFFGLQFFGRVDIDGKSGVMKDVGDRDLWSVDIPPQPDTTPAARDEPLVHLAPAGRGRRAAPVTYRVAVAPTIGPLICPTRQAAK